MGIWCIWYQEPLIKVKFSIPSRDSQDLEVDITVRTPDRGPSCIDVIGRNVCPCIPVLFPAYAVETEFKLLTNHG
jgi:hypothetical protein